jgi:predicted MFS family arabinose efflux permease
VTTPLPDGQTIPTRPIALLAVAGFASQAQVRVTDSLLPQIASDFGTSSSSGRSETGTANT